MEFAKIKLVNVSVDGMEKGANTTNYVPILAPTKENVKMEYVFAIKDILGRIVVKLNALSIVMDMELVRVVFVSVMKDTKEILVKKESSKQLLYSWTRNLQALLLLTLFLWVLLLFQSTLSFSPS